MHVVSALQFAMLCVQLCILALAAQAVSKRDTL